MNRGARLYNFALVRSEKPLGRPRPILLILECLA